MNEQERGEEIREQPDGRRRECQTRQRDRDHLGVVQLRSANRRVTSSGTIRAMAIGYCISDQSRYILDMMKHEERRSSRSHDHHDGHAHGHGHRHHFGGGGGRRGFGRGGWGEAEDGRGGRRRRIFDAGELRLVLLKLISDHPRHGYELIRAIEELSGGFYVPSPGVVYPTLTMLHEMGQIEEAAARAARGRRFR